MKFNNVLNEAEKAILLEVNIRDITKKLNQFYKSELGDAQRVTNLLRPLVRQAITSKQGGAEVPIHYDTAKGIIAIDTQKAGNKIDLGSDVLGTPISDVKWKDLKQLVVDWTPKDRPRASSSSVWKWEDDERAKLIVAKYPHMKDEFDRLGAPGSSIAKSANLNPWERAKVAFAALNQLAAREKARAEELAASGNPQEQGKAAGLKKAADEISKVASKINSDSEQKLKSAQGLA